MGFAYCLELGKPRPQMYDATKPLISFHRGDSNHFQADSYQLSRNFHWHVRLAIRQHFAGGNLICVVVKK